MDALLRVKKPRYLAAFAAIGCHSKTAIAQVCKLDTKSVYSALEGKQVGEHFIKQTILTLRKQEYSTQLRIAEIDPTMDSLFEVALVAVA